MTSATTSGTLLAEPDRWPLLRAALLLGIGLGGFIDGIVLHQLLQWHNLLSHRLPPDTLAHAKINMFWDGIFHAGTWLVTMAGVWLLWRAGRSGRHAWSGRLLAGGMLAGWGLFNLVEGLIDHHWLHLHHVRDAAAVGVSLWDYGFLAVSLALALLGWAIAAASSHGRRSGGRIPEGRELPTH